MRVVVLVLISKHLLGQAGSREGGEGAGREQGGSKGSRDRTEGATYFSSCEGCLLVLISKHLLGQAGSRAGGEGEGREQREQREQV